MGFILNPYNSCVANAVIDGKQCTIVWHVDDKKTSHMDRNVVTSVIDQLEDHFEKMTVPGAGAHVPQDEDSL